MRYFKIFLVVIALMMAGCDQRSEVVDPIKVGISQWVGYTPVRVAGDKGFYGETSVSVSVFSSSSETINAFKHGFLHVAALTLDEVLYLSKEVDNLEVFLVCDISGGGDAIVANKTIESLDGLKGKIVGVEPGVLGAFILTRALKKQSKLQIEDVIVRPLRLKEQVASFAEQAVDAVVTYEPYKSRLFEKGGHVIFDSSMLPGEIVDVLVVRSATLKKRGEEIRDLVGGWFKAQAFMAKKRNEALGMLGRYYNIPVFEMGTVLDGIKMPDIKANDRLLNSQGEGLRAEIKRLESFLNKEGILKNTDQNSVRLTRAYLPKAQ